MDLSKITMYDACLLHSRAERVLKGLVSTHLENYELTRMEWLLLATVNTQSAVDEGHTMGELAELLDIRLSQVTALTSTLHTARLITQTAAIHDKRTRYVAITNKGSKLLAEIEASMRGAMRTWLKGIPREQLTVHLQTVKQLGSEV